MKKKIFAFSIMLVFTGFLLFLNNCKKAEQDDISVIAKDNAIADKAFADVKSMSDNAANNNSSFFIAETEQSMFGSNVVITYDTVNNNKRITIDFGTTNTLCSWDGAYRRGKIIITYTGKYRDPGTIITITFDNYAVDDNEIDNISSKTITNNGRNTSGKLTYTVQVTSKILTYDKRTVTWTSTRTNEWIAGENTIFNWQDDEYLITGNASGISGSGNPWTISVTKALHVKLNCRWITEGTVDILPSGKLNIVLDYGNGNCDHLATATYNGKVNQIVM